MQNKIRGKYWTLLAIVFAACSGAAIAQQAPQSQNLASAAGTFISPGDLLDITIADTPASIVQEVRVEESGEVALDLLGPTKVAGMTAQKATQTITSQLISRNFYIRPQVTVLIKEFAVRSISVTGEVKTPGVYPMLTARSLLDAISQAGGVTNLADSKITVQHRSGSQDVVTANYHGDNAAVSLGSDVTVYPGDLIFVPRAGVVYVLGGVRQPGGFVMQDNGKISMLSALSLAGGPDNLAALNSALLLHKNAGTYTTEKIRVSDMLHGRIADIIMSPNDILFIPASKLKIFAQNTAEITNTAAGAAIYHTMP